MFIWRRVQRNRQSIRLAIAIIHQHDLNLISTKIFFLITILLNCIAPKTAANVTKRISRQYHILQTPSLNENDKGTQK